MRLSYTLNRSHSFGESVELVVAMEQAGLDQVLVPESYSIDAVSRVGYLAAKTERVEVGTGILNVFSRTATAVAQTAAGCDLVSGGRFVLGLGASGPQVVEGFHGVPFERPKTRVEEYIEACRAVLRRDEPFRYDGRTVQVPLPRGTGTGLGRPLKIIERPLRPTVPIWWASLMAGSVEATARLADGWLTILFLPDRAGAVWTEPLRRGRADRAPSLGPLDVLAGGMVAIGEDLVGDRRRELLDLDRPRVALYVGGMGARDGNFYNDLFKAYGFDEAAARIQDLYLDGHKAEAEAAVPVEVLELLHLIGPAGHVRERLAAYAEAGVTVLNVLPVGDRTAAATVAALRELL